MEHLPALISAIATLAVAFFSYHQYTKNKMTDLKIERYKAEMEVKTQNQSRNISQIYGVLWQMLHDLQADRVYVIQPHPLVNNLYLSIGLEVKRNGVIGMRDVVQNLPMSDVAAFSAELSQRDFLYFKNVEQNIKDKRARAILSCNGSASAIIKKLSDDDHNWIGSLVCEFMHEMNLDPIYAKTQLSDAAERVQYILPEFKQG